MVCATNGMYSRYVISLYTLYNFLIHCGKFKSKYVQVIAFVQLLVIVTMLLLYCLTVYCFIVVVSRYVCMALIYAIPANKLLLNLVLPDTGYDRILGVYQNCTTGCDSIFPVSMIVVLMSTIRFHHFLKLIQTLISLRPLYARQDKSCQH